MRSKLKRELGLWQLTLINVGIILGAGIYVLIGKAAGLAGNAMWISFILSAIVATFTGLSYVELSSIFPRAGAEYVYIDKTLGKRLAWIAGWMIILSGIIGAATVSIGFGEIFSNFFNEIFKIPNIPIILTAMTLILISGMVLLIGIKESALLTVIATTVEAIGLILIIFIGLPYIGTINYLEIANKVSGIFEASALIFFAYIGFETVARLSEETKNPTKTVPMAIILSIAITTILYILVAVSAVSVIGWKSLSVSENPLSDVAFAAFGERGILILSIIALFATSNTVIVAMLGTSRIIYGIAEFKALPRTFLSVSRKTHTPWNAIIAVTIASMMFTLLGDITTIANLTNLTIFITFILVNGSVIWLRYKRPGISSFKSPGHIGKVPLLPVLGIATCLFMMINIEFIIWTYVAILIIIGLLIYEIREIIVNHKMRF